MRLLIFPLLMFMLSCSYRDNKVVGYDDINYNSSEDIRFHDVKIDTLLFPSDGLSMEGHFEIIDKKLAFCDEVFAMVQLYELNGNKGEKYFGRGPGPDELPGLYKMVINKNPDDGFVVLDQSWGLHLIDDNFKKESYTRINFKNIQSMQELVSNPSFDNPALYELEYYNANLNLKDNTLLIPITTEHPNLNSLANNCEQYYRDTYLMGAVDVRSGEITKMLGRRSPVYLNYKNLPNFNFAKILWQDDVIYFTFEIDQNIYKMDINGNLINAFGLAGKGINNEYPETKTISESEMNFFEHREKYGYYNSLKADDGLLFRGYQRGSLDVNDGLQIYDNEILIGDIDVPKGSKYIGYADGSHYLQIGMDIDNEIFIIGKFKLE